MILKLKLLTYFAVSQKQNPCRVIVPSRATKLYYTAKPFQLTMKAVLTAIVLQKKHQKANKQLMELKIASDGN